MPSRLVDDSDGLKCPNCGARKSEVIDSRGAWGMRGRRRRCSGCGETFKTYEVVIPVKWKSVFVSLVKTMLAYRRQGPDDRVQR